MLLFKEEGMSKSTSSSFGVNKTKNLTYDASVFNGKHVLLFDDVKTSGGSFIQNANKIKALGASNVTGVFLGETYDSFAKGTPSWASALNLHQVSAPTFYSSSVDNDLPF
jgi:hypoxanthine phosphoribosyltransferase